MFSKVQKWGNSLALRIPKALADEINLENESAVEIRIVNGELHIVPITDVQYELEALLADVSPENIHREVDTGNALGNEVW